MIKNLLESNPLKSRSSVRGLAVCLAPVLLPLENATPGSLIETREQARQMRMDRLDAGDENVALTFVYRPPQPRAQYRYILLQSSVSSVS